MVMLTPAAVATADGHATRINNNSMITQRQRCCGSSNSTVRFYYCIALSCGIVAISLLLLSSSVPVVVMADTATTAANSKTVPSITSKCEILKATLQYTQEDAPTDLSGVLPVVVERINTVLEGVVDVEVEWTGGDLQGQVGEHYVQCKVTRLASISNGGGKMEIFVDEDGRNVFTQCFHVPFTILDTNECTLPNGHSMKHQCHEPAICVNTIGSYECICPRIDSIDSSSRSMIPATVDDDNYWIEIAAQSRGPWELSFQSTTRSSCPGKASTYGCCPSKIHTTRGDSQCRSSFRCPKDPCVHNNTCASNAACTRAATPTEHPDYICQCPNGLMGNGKQCRSGDKRPEPKVKFDGITPTEYTVKNNYFCGCTKPIVDACDGFPPCAGKHQICTVTGDNTPICACKPGFVLHSKFGCVDESPPILRLKNDPNGDRTLRLKQGDVYKEYAVEIQDENAEEYLRSLKIAYSQPLPSGCVTEIGEFHVNYTVATPWTSPPYVRVTRRVIIDDIDECTIDTRLYEKKCPALIHKCDTTKGATCVNTIGSYSCMCPKYTTGDGFIENSSFGDLQSAPQGYRGGTSCYDTTPPIISLRGPNPKVFRVCACSGISGIIATNSIEKQQQLSKHDDIKMAQQSHYGSDIKDLISMTNGAELCATQMDRSPNASDCVFAYDETYKGRVDLSKAVVVGEPVKKSSFRWSVPYNLVDAAGNAAATVWRDVVVEEVDLAKVEAKIREEFVEIQRAKDKAMEEERRIRERNAVNNRESRTTSPSCAECPKCDTPGNGKLNEAACQAICDQRMKSCAIDEESFVVQLLIWLERYFPPSMIPTVLICNAIVISLLMLRWILTLLFNPQAYQQRYYNEAERERALMNAVMYHQNTPVVSNGLASPSYVTSPQPQVMGNHNNSNGHYSASGKSVGLHSDVPISTSSATNFARNQSVLQEDNFADIYQSPIITPSKRGDGVRRRTTPYTTGSNQRSM